MVQQEALAAVLSDFARTLATDFPIQGILDHLVERIVDVLPITAAGVTLIRPDENPQYIAASNADALRFEQMQTEFDEGPCLDAYRTGEAVAVPDLATDRRFGLFGPPAVAAGLAAVFTFPLRSAGGRLGALDLYRDAPGELAAEDLEAAQTLADVAAAYLLNAQARDEASSASDRFRHIALHDPLTGLPNRLLLQQRLEHLALRGSRTHAMAAILFADLDGFKRVNDTHGHQVGDQLLLAVAQRLTHLIRPGDTLCRYAGDEFVFLCEDVQTQADAEQLATRIDAAFSHPFQLDEFLELTVTASIGMAFAGPGEDITDQLLVEADTAMYQAKRRGGAAHQLIDLREASAAAIRRDMEIDLRAAMERGQLALAYQPIVRTADCLVTGVEALLRWCHPERGQVDADTAIRLAEGSGQISKIGSWVLMQACRDHATWSCRGGRPDLAVNVSPRQLMEPAFLSTVTNVVTRAKMNPASLILEITENVLIDDLARATTVLDDLRTLGIRIALDDFGTGYSSLSYLRQLPIDIVKIDQSFVADIGRTPSGSAMISAVTDLAHLVGLTVVAEGVETQQQRDIVLAAGCELAQGYFYAHPQPASTIALQHDRYFTTPLRLTDTATTTAGS
ncbi:MAG: Diguanylate cyclase protein [Frankiales bacterium]|nr:Diguanylate cyclase protein [Frankiales bacterium]